MLFISEEIRNSLTLTEIDVLDWIIENEKKIPNMSITRIAEDSFSSPATVSRTIRKCGFSGIGELKYRIQSPLDEKKEGEIVNEIFARHVRDCRDAVDNLDAQTLLRIVHHIKFADHIYILAAGIAANIGKEFETNLMLFGYPVNLIDNRVIMERHTKHLFRNNHVVIVLSSRGTTPELAIAARYAKENGATVISCCCIEVESLQDCSDIFIYGSSKGSVYTKKYNIISYLPIQIITQTIIDYLML